MTKAGVSHGFCREHKSFRQCDASENFGFPPPGPELSDLGIASCFIIGTRKDTLSKTKEAGDPTLKFEAWFYL